MITLHNLTGTNLLLKVQYSPQISVLFPPGTTRCPLFEETPDVVLMLPGDEGEEPTIAGPWSMREITVGNAYTSPVVFDDNDNSGNFFAGFALVVTAFLVVWVIRYAQRALSTNNADPL